MAGRAAGERVGEADGALLSLRAGGAGAREREGQVAAPTAAAAGARELSVHQHRYGAIRLPRPGAAGLCGRGDGA